MAIQATGRATFTAVEDYDIVFVLNGIRCDTLNFDSVQSAESAMLEADFTNGGAPYVVDKAVLACYDGEGNLMGSPIEVHDSSSAIADGGNLYLSKDCKTITCDIYAGDKKLCSKSMPVIRNGESVGVKAVGYKVINNVDANASLNWDGVTAQTSYPTQKPDKGKYCYVMTIVLYTDGTSTNTVSTSYTPNDGIGVKTTTTVTYARTSENKQPADFPLTSVPTDLAFGEYLWSKTVVTYQGVNTETTTSIAVSRVGKDGAVGYSLHMLYSNVEKPGTDVSHISTSMQAGYDYIYVYSDQSTTDDPQKGLNRTFKKIKGEAGADGVSAATYQLTTTQTIVSQSDTANKDGSYSWVGLTGGKIKTTAFGYHGAEPLSVTAAVESQTNCKAKASGADIILTAINDTDSSKPKEGSIVVGIYAGGVKKASITWRLYFNRVGEFVSNIKGSVKTEVASKVSQAIKDGDFVKTSTLGEYVRSDSEAMSSLTKVVDNGWSSQTYTGVMQQTAEAISMGVRASMTGNLLKDSNKELSATASHKDTTEYPYLVGIYKYAKALAKGTTATLTASVTTATAGTTVWLNFNDGGATETVTVSEDTEAHTVSVTHTMAKDMAAGANFIFNQGTQYASETNEVKVAWAVLLYGKDVKATEWQPTEEEKESKFLLRPDKAGIVTTDGNGNSASIETSTDSGGTVKIKAANIAMEGLVTANGGFKVDSAGSVTATGATINGIFLTKYPDGKAQLVINDGGLTYYADDADHTVIWSLGRSGNIVRNQTIDHWETVYLMKVPINTMEVYYDKKEGNSYYVVGKVFHKFVAGDSSTNTDSDGLVTESNVTDSTSPSSVTGITGNYVAGSSEGSAIMQTTSGKYTQERYIYTSGKADKETTTCTSDTPIDINTLTDIS